MTAIAPPLAVYLMGGVRVTDLLCRMLSSAEHLRLAQLHQGNTPIVPQTQPRVHPASTGADDRSSKPGRGATAAGSRPRQSGILSGHRIDDETA
jgi:hypothetical protein